MWILAQDGKAYNRESFNTIEILERGGKFVIVALHGAGEQKEAKVSFRQAHLETTNTIELGAFDTRQKAEMALHEVVSNKDDYINLKDNN